MGRETSSRTKHLGFKPPGESPAHDAACAVLAVLPRGTASDFVAAAIAEYLANHMGETVGGRNVYIIPAAEGEPQVSPSAGKPSRSRTNKMPAIAVDNGGSPLASDKPTEDASKTQEVSEPATAGESKPPDIQGGAADTAQAASYTELDDEMLSKLVAGFGNFPQ